MNGSGTAQLALEYGQGAVAASNTATYNVHAPVNLPAGQNFSTKLGSNGVATNYTVITNLGVAGDATSTTLQGMKNALSGNFALGANIDATATSTWNTNAGFAPIGNNATNNNTTRFLGKFDGLGHTISNLTIYLPALNYVGLFGVSANTAEIKNVGLIGGSVYGHAFVGGLLGYNQNSATVNNSYSSIHVSGTSNDVGGLLGRNAGAVGSIATVSNSYSSGTVSGGSISTDNLGGLTGENYGIVNNSYSTGSVSGGAGIVGGMIGSNFGTVSNSYSTGTVSGTSSNVGGLIASNSSGTVTNSFWDTQTSGQSASAVGTGLTTAQMMAQANFTGFDFTNTWWMSDTNTRPFLRSEWSTNITNAHQLQLMSSNLSANYTLANNLDLSSELSNASGMWDMMKGFVPVGSDAVPFTGNFDGQNHTINGLKINRPTTNDSVGLFGSVSGDIQNVGLINATITGQNRVGALAGTKITGLVSNSYSTGSVSGTNEVGGLLGRNNAPLNNSYSNSTVNGTKNDVGGLVGFNFRAGQINDSYSTGAVTGTLKVGGLIGRNDGTLSNSYYNINTGLVNNIRTLSETGLSAIQFNDWLVNNKTLQPITSSNTNADYIYTVSELQNALPLSGSLYKFKIAHDIIDLSKMPASWFTLNNLSHTESNSSPNFVGPLYNQTATKFLFSQCLNSTTGLCGWISQSEQLLQQAGTAMLAQANQSGQSVMTLLR